MARPGDTTGNDGAGNETNNQSSGANDNSQNNANHTDSNQNANNNNNNRNRHKGKKKGRNNNNGSSNAKFGDSAFKGETLALNGNVFQVQDMQTKKHVVMISSKTFKTIEKAEMACTALLELWDFGVDPLDLQRCKLEGALYGVRCGRKTPPPRPTKG